MSKDYQLPVMSSPPPEGGGREGASRTKWLVGVIAPIFVIIFFTTMMNEGLPMRMPIGIVDLDNSQMTRRLIRNVDAFQSSSIKKIYKTEAEAREALQNCEIYGFLVFPEKMTEHLLAGRRPTVAIYYNTSFFTGGTLAYKELRTIATLAKAGVGKAKLLAQGLTEKQANTLLQPVVHDVHMIGNPWANYNAYLSTMIVPGLIIMFVMMLSVYVLGEELRKGTAKQLLERHNGNIVSLLVSKLLPVACLYLVLLTCCMVYFYTYLGFPHQGGWLRIMGLVTLMVLAAQGFAVFVFGLIPHFRMALSVCSLWAVLNLSMSGAAFPINDMHPILQALQYVFPLRLYFMTFQLTIFHGYPLHYAQLWIFGLAVMACLPLLVLHNIKKAYREFDYLP